MWPPDPQTERLVALSLIFVSLPVDADLPDLVNSVLAAMPGSQRGDDVAASVATDGPVAVILDPADVDIARRLADGVPLAQAVDDWARMIGDCIGALRSHRRQVTVMDRRALSTRPAEVLATVAARYGLPPPSPSPYPSSPEAGPEPDPGSDRATPDGDPILVLAAAAGLMASPQHAGLVQEIEAMLLGLPDAGPDPGQLAAAAVAQRARFLAAIDEAGAATAAARAETQLLTEQGRWMQTDMEQLTQELTALQTAQAADQARRARATALETELDALQDSHASVLATMAELDRQVAADRVRAVRAETRTAGALAERDAARADADALRASTSWRVTAPLRAVRIATTRKTGDPA